VNSSHFDPSQNRSDLQVAEVLSKLVRMLAEVTVIVEQREPIMKVIADIEESFKEAHWHFLHKQDKHFNNRVPSSCLSCITCFCFFSSC
jgi:hypothetical protein